MIHRLAPIRTLSGFVAAALLVPCSQEAPEAEETNAGEVPPKYLQQLGNDPRLRFEIDAEGKVGAIHAGMLPQLEYVEGCS